MLALRIAKLVWLMRTQRSTDVRMAGRRRACVRARVAGLDDMTAKSLRILLLLYLTGSSHSENCCGGWMEEAIAGIGGYVG